jgi:hypothetical protein
MNVHVEHAMVDHQGFVQGKYVIDVFVHQACASLLLKQAGANGRVTLDLAPLAGLLVEHFRVRQFA